MLLYHAIKQISMLSLCGVVKKSINYKSKSDLLFIKHILYVTYVPK